MGKKKVVLVVDDEPDVIEMLRMRLDATGFAVITAKDGAGGLKMARSKRPDLILLDIMLPVLDGYQVLKMLKADEKMKRIPVIMLTAKQMVGDMDEAMRAGADAYITKPYDWDVLLKKIDKYTKKDESGTAGYGF